VRIIDADLGRSGASTAGRSGFAELTTLVGLGQVGIVLALEVSRLARNNSDWYRLLDLAGMTNTLLADADGVYHPGLFNDRMLLGLKGTMSEAELHVLRARLDGGIRNKAKRGELRRGLPVGLVWGEEEGQILLHPDEAVTGVIAAVFARFAACGSVRGTWLWLREQAPATGGRRDIAIPTGDLGGADLPCGAHHAHPPRVCRCLRLRPHPRREIRHPGRGPADPAAPDGP
jgi:DNA invertase Pin-like site-specific DNA recombinase